MMKDLKKYTTNTLLAAAMLLAAGCSAEEDTSASGVPEGMIQVNFQTAGTYGAPLSDLKSSRAATDKDNIPIDPDPYDEKENLPYDTEPIPEGTTLWVAVYKGDPTVEEDLKKEPIQVKSYRVSNHILIPCVVDDDGNVLKADDGTDMYDTPLYLEPGKYFFRAVGPARKLVKTDDEINGINGINRSLNIDNGQWVIANDERYVETSIRNAVVTLTEDEPDRLVRLDPLINQTARLKFTLYSEANDPFVHSLKMQPIGIEVSGLQDHYSEKNAEGEPWNWTLCSIEDTLIAYPDNKHTLTYLKDPSVSTNDRFVIETPILPTDAVSKPLIVLFNMEVNGNPTQFEMMLNRKMFLAAYSYHYRGKVKIDNGVAAIDWESVSWSADIPFFPSTTSANP